MPQKGEGFNLTDGRFQIEYKNGVVVSISFPLGRLMEMDKKNQPTADVAIFYRNGDYITSYYTNDEENTIPKVSPKELFDILVWAEKQ